MTSIDALVWGITGAFLIAMIGIFYLCTSSVHPEADEPEVAEALNKKYCVNNARHPAMAAVPATTPLPLAVEPEPPTVRIPIQQATSVADTIPFGSVLVQQPPPQGLDMWYRSFAATGEIPVMPVQDFLSGRYTGQVE